MWQVPAIVPTYNIIRSPASLPPCLPQVEVLKSTGEGASHLSSLRPAQLPHNLSEDNWRERAAFQRSAFGRSTAGNDVVATIFIRIFFFFSLFFPVFFFRFFFSPSRPFLIEGVRIKKLIKRKLMGTPKNLGVDTFPDPFGHFGAP